MTLPPCHDVYCPSRERCERYAGGRMQPGNSGKRDLGLYQRDPSADKCHFLKERET